MFVTVFLTRHQTGFAPFSRLLLHDPEPQAVAPYLRHAGVDKLAGGREIARALSISNGSADRALHSREGVTAKTVARVLKMAKELGYRPISAPALSSSIDTSASTYSYLQSTLDFEDVKTVQELLRHANSKIAP